MKKLISILLCCLLLTSCATLHSFDEWAREPIEARYELSIEEEKLINMKLKAIMFVYHQKLIYNEGISFITGEIVTIQLPILFDPIENIETFSKVAVYMAIQLKGYNFYWQMFPQHDQEYRRFIMQIVIDHEPREVNYDKFNNEIPSETYTKR